jgi:hypothetical protein
MPAINNSKQRDARKTVTEKRTKATASFQPGRKAIGTRLGTLNDWRAGSNKSGKGSRPHGSSLRDGRA